MSNANINERASIEAIYPRAVFLRESNANARAKASMLRGLSIRSAPDADGNIAIARAARHVGEQTPDEGALFLCPFAQATPHAAEYPAAATAGAAADPRDPYDEFIDRVIAAARTAPLPEPTGRGDPRLKGLRQ